MAVPGKVNKKRSIKQIKIDISLECNSKTKLNVNGSLLSDI